MANVTLKITLTMKDGANDAWMVIDNGPDAYANGVAFQDVDDALPTHKYVIWVDGPPGSSCAFKIEQGKDSLLSDTVTVDPHQFHEVQHGKFDVE